MKRINHTGNRYGRLTAIEYAYSKRGIAYWKFQCDCGNEAIIRATNVKSSNSLSCGCYHKEMVREIWLKYGLATRLKHGDTIKGSKLHRLYKTFWNIRSRCENPNDKCFRWYCGKGITVCPGWDDYEVFKKWALANGYADSLTIDRIDNDGNYEPSNCQWLTRSENSKKGNRKERVMVIGGA